MGSDFDLQSITSNQIYDECVIEFDFVPEGDSISFNYVFVSEEYPEYVCASFNDAFGFFLTGPNPNLPNYNAENIALIPNPNNPSTYTNTPVAINTVNPELLECLAFPLHVLRSIQIGHPTIFLFQQYNGEYGI